MCEANAYLMGEEGEELLLEAVDLVEPVDQDQWRLVSIFGEQRMVKARIRHMALVDHKIFFEQVNPE